MFLRKCVVSVSLRFVFDFLIPFDFGGGLSFGGVVVTVSKRPFPYLSISFSTFFQRSKKGCVFFIYIFNVGVPLSSSNYLVGSFLHFAALFRGQFLTYVHVLVVCIPGLFFIYLSRIATCTLLSPLL